MEMRLAARDLAAEVDSAGQHAVVGNSPESAAIEAALELGADISQQRARSFQTSDFERFTNIIALDHGHLEFLKFMVPDHANVDIRLLLSGAPLGKDEVSDPFGRSLDVYRHTASLIARGVESLIDEIF